MKKLLLTGLALLLLFPALALGAVRPPAEPVSALFYPNEVQVTVEERLMPESLPGQGKGFVLSLPVRAAQPSFSVTINGTPAGSFYWLSRDEDISALERPADAPVKSAPPARTATRPDQEKDPARKAILQTIAGIHIEMEKYSVSVAAAEERIERWQKYSLDPKETKPADIIALDKALGDVLPGLFAAKSQGERQIQEAEQRLDEAEEALHEYDAGFSPESRLVAVIPFNESVGKPCVVRYTYILPGSYRTSYSIGAFPAKNSLSIEQNAFLNQTSGFTWNNVEVFISTTGRDTSLQPSPLPSWIVRLGSPQPQYPASRAEKAAEAPVNMAQMANEDIAMDYMRVAPEPAPTQEEMGTFRLWSIGRRTVESGVPVSVSMTTDSYEAKFYYTLRPTQNSKGFLTAELNLDKALELPRGQARFFVDNTLVGEQVMSLNGSKATLYFGTDPQVVVTRKDIKHSTGEQGFISKEQSVLWHWEFSVRNTRGRAVEVWLEDAQPDIQDESIKLTAESTPKPEEVSLKPQQGGGKTYRWKMTLEPNEVKTIDHKIQILAPSDKPLDPGRYN